MVSFHLIYDYYIWYDNHAYLLGVMNACNNYQNMFMFVFLFVIVNLL